jgi:MFS family permease
LGILTSARALGAVASSFLLAALPVRRDGVPVLVAHYAVYGLAMIGLACSGLFWVSACLMLLIGLAASSLDLLQQTLMQLSVPDADRGRAVGYWVAALGFGPVGHLEIGLMGSLLGAPLAMAANGVVVVAVFCVAVAMLRRRRDQPAPPLATDV